MGLKSFPSNDKQEAIMIVRTIESKNYLNYHTRVKEVHLSPLYCELNSAEEKLLNMLAPSWSSDTKITVLKAMGLDPDISHSTSHRLLKSLRLKGFITLLSEERDTRVKYVEPSEKTEQFFTQLGQCLRRAVKPQAEVALTS
jgi:predicted transcriptional regulator